MIGDQTLSANVLRFCRTLRDEHEFSVGPGIAGDALRAVAIAGAANQARVRTALRLICCASPEEIDIFEAAFDRFFFARAMPAQPRPSLARRLAPDPGRTPIGAPRPVDRGTPTGHEDETTEPFTAQERRLADDAPSDAAAWQLMRAKYSPQAAGATRDVAFEVSDALSRAAARLIACVRAGRSRRLRPMEAGTRLDLPRTFRAGLRTAGDPVYLRRLGRPPRNPRFLVFVDGSRSMAAEAAPSLAFAAALAQRSARTKVWTFSTSVREITGALRSGRAIQGIEGSWGGGTRIGSSILDVVRSEGGRLLTEDTTVLICSDGLDVGDLDALERALRQMRSRATAIVWLHPYAGRAGFRPAARALRVALPFLTALLPAGNTDDFMLLADRLVLARRSGRVR
jgi:uncharacterized protein with von Willebrand factor type A (vWA) domain